VRRQEVGVEREPGTNFTKTQILMGPILQNSNFDGINFTKLEF
jgi:hypothetical protein